MRLAGCLPPELQEHAGEELQLEHEEAARVLYVAATRARDLLVVTAVGDERREGWLGTLDPAIFPPVNESFKPRTNHPPCCPEFGPDNVAFRPNNGLRKPGFGDAGLAQTGSRRARRCMVGSIGARFDRQVKSGRG